MVPEQAPDAGSATSEQPAGPRPARRGGAAVAVGGRGAAFRSTPGPATARTCGRGRRAYPAGRGAPAEAAGAPATLSAESEASETAGTDDGAPGGLFRPARREQRPERPYPVRQEAPPPPPREFRPASPAAVTGAIEDVNQIIETLRATLGEMEDVLETLELAERQKIADEQEIETLRRGFCASCTTPGKAETVRRGVKAPFLPAVRSGTANPGHSRLGGTPRRANLHPKLISISDTESLLLPGAWAWLGHVLCMSRACLVQGGSSPTPEKAPLSWRFRALAHPSQSLFLMRPSLLPELVHVHFERSEPIREAAVLRIHLPRLLKDHRPRARSMDLLR